MYEEEFQQRVLIQLERIMDQVNWISSQLSQMRYPVQTIKIEEKEDKDEMAYEGQISPERRQAGDY